jgi:mevalonate kinase
MVTKNDENDKIISQSLQQHFDDAAEKLRDFDGWNLIDPAEISENQLLSVAKKFEIDQDEQTRSFFKLISFGTNFSSLDFVTRVKKVPEMVKNIMELIDKVKEEIKEYAEMANCFSEIIQCFIKLVIDTKHKMNMTVPHLKSITFDLGVLSDSLNGDELKGEDLKDIDIALNNMSDGIFLF